MSIPGEWEIIRHKVALCGRVFHPGGRPSGGAKVTITAAPKAFDAWVRNDSKAAVPHRNGRGRSDTTTTRRDGIYFFLDLPEGEYTVTAESPGSRERGQNHGKVTRNKDASIRMAVVEIRLSPRSKG
jgi:hypothetical protein